MAGKAKASREETLLLKALDGLVRAMQEVTRILENWPGLKGGPSR